MADALISSLERRLVERKLLTLAPPWAEDILFP